MQLVDHTRLGLAPLRFITCGSVDDGKSTLIGRLLWDCNALHEDQITSLKADSTKFGTQGNSIDYALLVDGLSAAAAAEGVPFAGDCEGGMFGFFLLPTLPSNYPQVMKTDGSKFNTLFHGLLDRGVYIAPALYEAGFVSGAHTAQDIAETVSAAREIFKSL